MESEVRQLDFNYFVSYTYDKGSGCTTIKTSQMIESIDDITAIIESIQNDYIKNVVIMNIQPLPI